MKKYFFKVKVAVILFFGFIGTVIGTIMAAIGLFLLFLYMLIIRTRYTLKLCREV